MVSTTSAPLVSSSRTIWSSGRQRHMQAITRSPSNFRIASTRHCRTSTRQKRITSGQAVLLNQRTLKWPSSNSGDNGTAARNRPRKHGKRLWKMSAQDPIAVDGALYMEIQRFLFREPALLDRGEYEAWLALTAEDIQYCETAAVSRDAAASAVDYSI